MQICPCTPNFLEKFCIYFTHILFLCFTKLLPLNILVVVMHFFLLETWDRILRWIHTIVNCFLLASYILLSVLCIMYVLLNVIMILYNENWMYYVIYCIVYWRLLSFIAWKKNIKANKNSKTKNCIYSFYLQVV